MLYIYTRKFWQSKNGEILFFRHHIISGTSTLLREPQPKVQVEYIFQSAILKMMSNQVEVNNNRNVPNSYVLVTLFDSGWLL